MTLAQNLVADGQGHSLIRLGWEFNGGWFPWAANGQQSNFIAYWKNIVTSMRSSRAHSSASNGTPQHGDLGVGDLATYHPGDAYVDVVGLDMYDTEWANYPGAASEWQQLLNQSFGLNWLSSFASTHGKPGVVPGVGPRVGSVGSEQRPGEQQRPAGLRR